MEFTRLIRALAVVLLFSVLSLFACVLYVGDNRIANNDIPDSFDTDENGEAIREQSNKQTNGLEEVIAPMTEVELKDFKQIERDKDNVAKYNRVIASQEADVKGSYSGNSRIVIPGFTGVFGEVTTDSDNSDDVQIIYMGIASAERDELWKSGKLNEDGTLKEELTPELIDEYGIEIDEGIEHSIGKVGIWGIDVSKYNKEIDWKQVKDAGVDYAIIRCGYRGASTGKLVLDPFWESNFNGAKAAGVKIGVYFFTQAVTEDEAREEANLALALTAGSKLDYPIFIDVEGYPGRASGLDAGARTNIVNAFIRTIQENGVEAGVYANKNWFTNHMYPDMFPDKTVKWLAQYNVTEPSYKGTYHMWQYSSKGNVPGIIGNVDVNQSYLDR